MKIRLLEIAQIELDQAIEYYNYESPGLGHAFLTEVLKAMDRISEFPEAWHPLSARTRRCQMRRFPYGVIYQVWQDEILIVAIANLHIVGLITGKTVYNILNYASEESERSVNSTPPTFLANRPHPNRQPPLEFFLVAT